MKQPDPPASRPTSFKVRPDILTVSGEYFDFIDFAPNNVLIEDIAHALSNICRFAGHTREFYSVAQHSVLVSQIVPPEHAMAGLLHDAPEAYLGDVTTPLKQLLPDYKALEKRIEADVLTKLGLPTVLPPEIKEADIIAMATEQRDLMAPHDDTWILTAGIVPLAVRIDPVMPSEAKRLFLNRYFELLGAGKAALAARADQVRLASL